MKIASSNINMENQYQEDIEVVNKTTTLAVQVEPQPSTSNQHDMVDLNTEKVSEVESTDNALEMPSIMILKQLIERLSKRPIEWFDSHNLTEQERAKFETAVTEHQQQQTTESQNVISKRWVLMDYQYHESQQNHFQLAGNLTLTSGEEINFNFDLKFEQQYSVYEKRLEQIELKDPLIISFTNRAVDLSDSSMTFDLDADGDEETFSQLEAGYGFLALDKNDNGKIDHGHELFGALSGNGFADLSGYDDDQNGFIDENDAIFSQLKVWVKNEYEDQLLTLSQAGIGAVSTHNVDSKMHLRDGDDMQGVIQKSGFYINDDGSAGLMQQVDFKV